MSDSAVGARRMPRARRVAEDKIDMKRWGVYGSNVASGNLTYPLVN